MHPTQNPAVYRQPVDTRLSASEIDAAKVRLGAHLHEVDYATLVGQLRAIISLLALEAVGQHAWELIREAQADIEAFNALMYERIARWHYHRDDAPEETTLGVEDVHGYAIGRAVNR